jgi:hypothetical protein
MGNDKTMEERNIKAKAEAYCHGIIPLDELRQEFDLNTVQCENIKNAKSLKEQSDNILEKLVDQLAE